MKLFNILPPINKFYYQAIPLSFSYFYFWKKRKWKKGKKKWEEKKN